MLQTLFNNPHLFSYLDIAAVFIITASAVYLSDHLPFILRDHPMTYQLIRRATVSEFYWPITLIALGLLMLLFVEIQLAISSLFVLGYGIWIFHRLRSLIYN